MHNIESYNIRREDFSYSKSIAKTFQNFFKVNVKMISNRNLSRVIQLLILFIEGGIKLYLINK